MHANNYEQLLLLIDDYNKIPSKTPVSVEYVPFGNLKKQLYFRNSTGDLPDMVIVDNPDNAALAEEGLLADISLYTSSWQDRGAFYYGPWNSGTYKGRQYGIPVTSNCLALFYDKKALKEAGLAVPETWEELKSAAKILSTKTRFGFASSFIRTEEGSFHFLPWLLSAGGDISSIDSPAGHRTLNFLYSLVQDNLMSFEAILWNQDDTIRQLATGNVAMIINGPWNIGPLKEQAPDLDFGIAKIPHEKQWASVLGGENIAILKNGQKDAAWDFISWFTAKEQVDRYTSATGYFPPRMDVAKESERWNSDPLLKAFADQMEYAMPRGPHPRWPEISEILIRTVHEVLSGNKGVDRALKDAQRDISAIY